MKEIKDIYAKKVLTTDRTGARQMGQRAAVGRRTQTEQRAKWPHGKRTQSLSLWPQFRQIPRSATGAESGEVLELVETWELWEDETVLEEEEVEEAIVLVRSADRPELEADATEVEELLLTPRGTGVMELTTTEDSRVANAFELLLVAPEVLWSELEPEYVCDCKEEDISWAEKEEEEEENDILWEVERECEVEWDGAASRVCCKLGVFIWTAEEGDVSAR